MNFPIIFIHYGNSPYLEYTLKLAKFKNPNKEVILLGDESNKKTAVRAGASHFYFERYFNGEEAEKFRRVYKFIAGNKKRKSFWTNFVFKRWFCIYNFLKENSIDKFWTFDSDTLILSDLSRLEERFANVDCTTQCNGICMNGFVSNLKTVKGYVDKINELFERDGYLKRQGEEMAGHPDWAFTEMRAFAAYEEESGIKTARTNSAADGSLFDENICERHGMETEFSAKAGREVKKLYFREGGVFEKRTSDGAFLRLNAVNMSWVPLSFIENVYYYGMRGKLPGLVAKSIFALKKAGRFAARFFIKSSYV